MGQRSGDGRFGGLFEVIGSIEGYTYFPNFETLDADLSRKVKSKLEALHVAAVSCARKAGEPEESTVREQHGRSRDEGAREG